MISELTFIRTYNTFWQVLFPGGDDYIRLLNSAIRRDFKKEVNLNDEPSRRALINSAAFALFELEKNNYQSRKTSLINSLQISDDTTERLIKNQIEVLSNLRYSEKLSPNISSREFIAIKTLAKRIYSKYAFKPEIIIRPKFEGCGIIFQANGDIYYENTLVEIKSGQRSFSIQDLRQLYVYAALNHINQPYRITHLELFNPRTGHFWNEEIDIVSDSISGSPTMEILNEIIYFISTEHILD